MGHFLFSTSLVTSIPSCKSLSAEPGKFCRNFDLPFCPGQKRLLWRGWGGSEGKMYQGKMYQGKMYQMYLNCGHLWSLVVTCGHLWSLVSIYYINTNPWEIEKVQFATIFGLDFTVLSFWGFYRFYLETQWNTHVHHIVFKTLNSKMVIMFLYVSHCFSQQLIDNEVYYIHIHHIENNVVDIHDVMIFQWWLFIIFQLPWWFHLVVKTDHILEGTWHLFRRSRRKKWSKRGPRRSSRRNSWWRDGTFGEGLLT